MWDPQQSPAANYFAKRLWADSSYSKDVFVKSHIALKLNKLNGLLNRAVMATLLSYFALMTHLVWN